MQWRLLHRTPVRDSALRGRISRDLSSSRARGHLRRRWVVALLLLVSLLAMAAYGAVSAVNVYLQYRSVRAEATDGLHHVQRVQILLATYMKHPAIPDA